MPKWPFNRDAGNEAEAEASSVLELMVLEGTDAGQQFTVDGPSVLIGRGNPKTAKTGAIFLHDTTVSSQQATIAISRDGKTATLEHSKSATNPTLVNGRPVRRQKIRPGDRLQMGRVVIEVRSRKGIALSGLFKVETTSTQPILGVRTEVEATMPQTRPGDTGDLTELRDAIAPKPSFGSLVLQSGLAGREEERFSLQPGTTVLGRSLECDCSIPEPGISRRHAQLSWQVGDLVLENLSATNATYVNAARLTEPRRLQHGDEIALADLVVLRVDLSNVGGISTEDRPTLPPPAPQPGGGELRELMNEAVSRQKLIDEFRVHGSFVDIDVVGSYQMKADAVDAACIIVSFENFREFVEGVVSEFGGQVLNSNGDELMCFFESTHDAVRSASAILSRLDAFNQMKNELKGPFRFRIGAHTGTSLVDRKKGVAYSSILDIAGHLQKDADVNGLLISQSTLDALPEGLPFEPAGMLERERIATYRMTAPLE